MTDWQPIETAPKDGTAIILYDRFCRDQDHARYVGRWVDDHYAGAGWVTYPGAYRKPATHWMPLQKPPS